MKIIIEAESHIDGIAYDIEIGKLFEELEKVCYHAGKFTLHIISIKFENHPITR